MSLNKTRSPGWYPDRSNPDLLRYYDGFDWTPRQRIRPEWADAPAIVVSLSRRPRRQRMPAAVVLALVLAIAGAFAGQGIAALTLRSGKAQAGSCETDLAPLRRSRTWEMLLGPSASIPKASAPAMPSSVAVSLRRTAALMAAGSPAPQAAGAWRSLGLQALHYSAPGGATIENLRSLRSAALAVDAAASQTAPACSL